MCFIYTLGDNSSVGQYGMSGHLYVRSIQGYIYILFDYCIIFTAICSFGDINNNTHYIHLRFFFFIAVLSAALYSDRYSLCGHTHTDSQLTPDLCWAPILCGGLSIAKCFINTSYNCRAGWTQQAFLELQQETTV